MAKVTVYVSDEQLDKLRRIKRFSRGGVSRAFQTFIDEMESGGSGRYEYARRLMPVSASIERARKALAGKVSAGGPPADGGPIAAALTILVYRHLVDQQPELEEVLRNEFARFGLDDLVGTETEGIDLLAEPAEDDADEGQDDDDEEAPMGIFGAINLAKEIREIGSVLRDSGVLHMKTRHGSRTEIRVEPGDDPRDLLSAREFDTFKERHPDWSDERDLNGDEIRTIAGLLRGRYRSEGRRSPADASGEGAEGTEDGE